MRSENSLPDEPVASSAMLLSALFVLFFLSLGAHSTTLKEYQDEVPGHEGQCLGRDKKTFFKLGETMTTDLEPCTRKVCRGSAQPGSVYAEVQTCSKVDKQPGCELKADQKKSFPDCCARLECPRA